MNKFKSLYVLESLLKDYSKRPSENVIVIAVQHLLSSTGSLFEAVVRLGIEPKNIYLLGKIYSTHAKTEECLSQLGINIINATEPSTPGRYTETLESDVKRLWATAMKGIVPSSLIIVLDDGGYAIKNLPEQQFDNHRVVGIEQTMSGIKLLNKNFKNLPVISVAGSAAKTIIEPPIVSEAVKIRLGDIIAELHPKRIGVIGYGNIGFAITKQLTRNYRVEVYDKDNKLYCKKIEGVSYSNDIHLLFANCDIIVGTTGEDISATFYNDWLKYIEEDKTLINISSGDVEFKSLLRNSGPQLSPVKSSLDTLEITTENSRKLRVLRGGMVANFTGEADSSPAPIIQVTRGLLLAAIIQILERYVDLQQRKGTIMLSPTSQKNVVSDWFKDQPQRKNDYSQEVLLGFEDENWIAQHSEGEKI